MPLASTSKHPSSRGGARRRALLVLVVLLTSRAAAASPAEPSDTARVQAKALMQEGARQMDDRQYDKAVASFSEAYRLVPSPKVLFNLGIAYLSVARYADALKALEGFLAEATDAPAASQATARRHIEELRAKVVSLELKSDRPGAELTLDGRSYGAVTFDHPLTIDPGAHVLRAIAGTDVAEQTFTAEPGQALSLTLTFAVSTPSPVIALPLAPAAEGRRPLVRRPAFWVAVGGAAVVVAAVVLVLALSHTEYPAVDARVTGP